MLHIIKDIFKKIGILLESVLGEVIKMYIRVFGGGLPCGVNTTEQRSEKIIVSLTSYGRRVSSVLPFTLRSLLCQTVRPDKVILWLDYDNWNDNNIPMSLKQLQKSGLTIEFCEDLRSYKKHVLALEQYPDDLVITVDDDFYYSSDFVERLLKQYNEKPDCIYTHRAHRPLFAQSGDLLPYNDWDLLIFNTSKSPVFATTGGGCLFKRSLLHADTTDKQLFQQLCPMADDVWFYFMSVLQKTPTMVLEKKLFTMIPLDNFYQLTHQNASLASANMKESYNDVQIKAVMQHYGIKPSDLLLQ